jgi:arylsulfatase A-like enzyme
LEREVKVIWLVISGLRADHLGAYGNRWLHLENIDRLADAGKVFTGAKSACADSLITRMEWLTGLDAKRFADPHESFKNYQSQLTLPAQLIGGGFKTALLTDNYPMLPIYEQLDVFDATIFIPGQAGDKHLSENFDHSLALNPKSKEIVTGANQTLPPNLSERYFRNRTQDQSMGRPEARLFDAAGRFLDSLKADDDWFILIDAFGLTPPWDSPADIAKYRQKNDLAAIAWPIAGPVDLDGEPSTRKTVNFLRRAYADQCLYLDNLVGHLALRITDYFEKEPFRFLLMSDQGQLIGDDNFLLENPDRDHSVLTQQVMIVLGHDVDDHSKTDESFSPVDLFTTTVEKTGIKNPPASDGQILENL